MTLVISMLNNIFLLHTKMKHVTLCHLYLQTNLTLHAKSQNYHLTYPSVLLYVS